MTAAMKQCAKCTRACSYQLGDVTLCEGDSYTRTIVAAFRLQDKLDTARNEIAALKVELAYARSPKGPTP